MWLVDGLPLHPLLVHLPVVLIPMVVLGLLAYLVVPRWRRPLGPVLAAVAVTCAIVAVAAVWTGEQLGDALRRGEELRSHRTFGERTRAYAIVLAVATGALVVYERRAAAAAAAARVTGAAAAVTVIAVGAAVAVGLTGHTGAKLAWEEEVAVAQRVAGDSVALPEPAPVPDLEPVVAHDAEPVVDVVLGEWALVTSVPEAPPGRVTFRFRNRGTVAHALRIRSAGSGKNRLEWRSNVVRPGEDGTLVVDLPAGSLELDCPIEDGHGEHDALGMETNFAVRETAPPVAAPTTPATPQEGGPATVDISGFEFTPTNQRVARGVPVRWVNADAAPHTATGDGWDTGRLGQGESGTITFDRPGTFSYVCAIHPAMTGNIIVT